MHERGLLTSRLAGVDHLAVAVEDLEAAVAYYRDCLGFSESERRVTQGRKTGRVSSTSPSASPISNPWLRT